MKYFKPFANEINPGSRVIAFTAFSIGFCISIVQVSGNVPIAKKYASNI
tara:strand:+ start:499 stop:645 length:147 start_codon:yes stop_codon:yes gene_type:complete